MSLLSPKDPTFSVMCGLFNSSHPEINPNFCIRLPQDATFSFNFIDKLISFAIFEDFFFKFLLLKRSPKDESNILTQCPLILNQNLVFHPMTPSFVETVFPSAPAFGSVSLHPYPFDIGVPPPPGIASILLACKIFPKWKHIEHLNTA